MSATCATISTIFEFSPVLIAVLSHNGQIQVPLSPSFRRLGYDERLLGTHFSEIALAAHRDGIRALLVRVRHGEAIGTHEHAWIAADGRVKWVDWTATYLPTATGSDGQIICSGIDITNLREERHLRQVEARKAQETERLALAAFQATPDSIVISTLDDGLIVNVNDGFERHFGWSRSEAIGRKTGELLWESPKARESFVRLNERNADRYEIYPQVLRLRDGTTRLFSISTRITSLEGKPHVLSVCTDISNQQRSIQRLIDAEREAVVGRMAARVAHEVNNPLAAMKAYLEPLQRRCLGQPELEEGLQLIESEVDRISSLLRELLGFVRQRTMNRTVVAIEDTIIPVINLFRPRCEKNNIQIEVCLANHLRPIRMDAGDVHQVIINLLENAVAEVNHGGHITVAVNEINGFIDIVVQDDGPGLGTDPERLFQPFTTGKPNGIGLGLPIARKICEAHGGSLVGRNRPTRGAEFIVRIPLQPSVRTPHPLIPRDHNA